MGSTQEAETIEQEGRAIGSALDVLWIREMLTKILKFACRSNTFVQLLCILLKAPEIIRAYMRTFGCLRTGLRASTTPNPCDIHEHHSIKEHSSRYMWFYDTTVVNETDEEMQVVWFEGFTKMFGLWVPGNVTGRLLTSSDFSEWYSDNGECKDGRLPAGASASCNPNWHGSNEPTSPLTKWAYIALSGDTKYYAETIIKSKPIKQNK